MRQSGDGRKPQGNQPPTWLFSRVFKISRVTAGARGSGWEPQQTVPKAREQSAAAWETHVPLWGWERRLPCSNPGRAQIWLTPETELGNSAQATDGQPRRRRQAGSGRTGASGSPKQPERGCKVGKGLGKQRRLRSPPAQAIQYGRAQGGLCPASSPPSPPPSEGLPPPGSLPPRSRLTLTRLPPPSQCALRGRRSGMARKFPGALSYSTPTPGGEAHLPFSSYTPSSGKTDKGTVHSPRAGLTLLPARGVAARPARKPRWGPRQHLARKGLGPQTPHLRRAEGTPGVAKTQFGCQVPGAGTQSVPN